MNVSGLGSSRISSINLHRDSQISDLKTSNTANRESANMPSSLAGLELQMKMLEEEAGKFNDLGKDIDHLEHQMNAKLGGTEPTKEIVDTKLETVETKSRDREEASVGEGGKTRRSFGQWVKDGLTAIKNFFTNLVSKISAKDVAETAGQMVDSHVQTSIGVTKEAITKALQDAPDFVDTGVADNMMTRLSSSLGKGGDVEKFKKVISDIKNKIDTQFEKATQGEDDKLTNLQNYSKKEFTTLALTNVVQNMVALTFSDISGDMLKNLASDMDEDSKALVSEMAALVDKGKTPLGSIELFGSLAKSAMVNNTEATFLRSTTNSEAACVRKIMVANGANDYAVDVLQSVSKCFKEKITYTNEKGKEQTFTIDEFAKQLTKIQNRSNDTGDSVSNVKDGGITNDIALKIGAVSLKLIEVMKTVPVPESMKTILTELQTELKENPNYDAPMPKDQNVSQGEKMNHSLFADQIFLKTISPIITVKFTSNFAVKNGQEFVGAAANGVRDQTKYPEAPREVFKGVSDQLHTSIDDILKNFGMKFEAN